MSILRDLFHSGLRLCWAPFRNSGATRIFFFHSVHPTDSLSHRPEQFRSYLEILKKHGKQGVSVNCLLKTNSTAEAVERYLGITFDDGYCDNLRWAAPALLDYGYSATFYIVTGMIGARNAKSSTDGNRLYPARRMLTANDVRELAALGFEIGSHTVTHCSMRAVYGVNPKKAASELVYSKQRLEDIIGSAVVSFAYPNGQRGTFSMDTHELAFSAGYQSVATTIWGTIRSSSGNILSRCESSSADTPSVFERKVLGGEDYRRLICLSYRRGRKWAQAV